MILYVYTYIYNFIQYWETNGDKGYPHTHAGADAMMFPATNSLKTCVNRQLSDCKIATLQIDCVIYLWFHFWVTATLRDQAISGREQTGRFGCSTSMPDNCNGSGWPSRFPATVFHRPEWLACCFSAFIKILKDAFHLIKSLRLVMCFPIFLWSNPNSHFNHQFLLVKSTRRLRFPLLSQFVSPSSFRYTYNNPYTVGPHSYKLVYTAHELQIYLP